MKIKIEIVDKGIKIKGVTSDSRKVKPGWAFVAVNGFSDNGNKYIQDAIAKGASAVYTEDKPDTEYSVPIYNVDDARQKQAQLAAELHGRPSQKLDLIGITGTNGKTTTSYLLHHLLNRNNEVGLLGTVEYKLGKDSIPATLTTPEADFIQYFLKQLLSFGGTGAVMEVSSHGIKLRRIDYLDFDVAVYTNLSSDHYDLHPDFSDYLQTKKRWFDNLNEDAVVVYNADDPFSEDVIGNSPAKTKIGFSMEGQGDLNGKKIKSSASGLEMEIQELGLNVKVPLLGKHNCYNVLAAVAVSLQLGIDKRVIERKLENFPGVWRRCQVIAKDPYLVIDDATHNPENFRAVFEAVKQLPYQKLHALVGIRGNRGWRINYENARTVGQWSKDMKAQLTVTKCLDTNGPLDKLAPAEEEAFTRGLWEQGVNFQLEETLSGALETTVDMLEPGDLMLLLGAHPFDNVREMILPLLQQRPIEFNQPIGGEGEYEAYSKRR